MGVSITAVSTPVSPSPARFSGVLSRLLRDRAGNVAAMMAAALFPLLALVGGGVDMGRGYLAKVQLQQVQAPF